MHLPTLRSPKTWLAAAGIVTFTGLGATAVAGPAWATPGTVATVATAAASRGSPTPHSRSATGTKAGAASRLATAKSRIEKRIDQRLARIDKARTQARTDPNLAALAGKLSDLRQQLVTLRREVAAATVARTLRSDVQSALRTIRTDPALQEVVVVGTADRLSTTIGKLAARVPAIQSRLDEAQAAGTDVTDARSALTDLQTRLTGAQEKLNGLASGVLSGATTVADARATLQADQADAKAIRADVQTIRQVLGGSSAGGPRHRSSAASQSSARL